MSNAHEFTGLFDAIERTNLAIEAALDNFRAEVDDFNATHPYKVKAIVNVKEPMAVDVTLSMRKK
jgi:hypothetical protein